MTLDVTNNSPADIPFVPGSRVATVQYGDARYDAGSANGPRYDDPAEYRRKSIDSEQPNLLPAGKKVTFWNSGLVPADQLGVLAIEVELPSEEGIRDPYTFTDAHTLLKTVN